MNCIFCCIFNQDKYIDMFYLLLESIFIYGNLDDTVHVLVYTSTPFMNTIKQSHLFNDKIIFELNDTYDTIKKSCRSRYDIFNLPSVSNYNKILYLDTDILVKNDIMKVFEVCKENILYTLEEGEINSDTNFWGKQLFGNEINNYTDKTAFTSGILLFNNCEIIKNLFNKTLETMNTNNESFVLNDQPFLVYNAFNSKIYNNKCLKSFAVNNDNNIHSNKVIHHFPGGPGIYKHKIENMKLFLNNMKDSMINTNIENAKEYINQHLLPIIRNCGNQIEGHEFSVHRKNICENFKTFLKSKNISNLVLNKNIKNVMEIGFNSGFSALLMLLSNPNIHITCVDSGEHKYTMPCYEKLKEKFGDRINIIIEDSTKTLSNVNNIYDLININRCNSKEVTINDIINSYRLSKKGTILTMNHYNFPNLHKLWDVYVDKYKLKSLNIFVYNSPNHDIKQV